MAPKTLRRIALATFVTLVLWIPLMFLHTASLGSLEDKADLIRTTSQLGTFHYINFINAVALTILDAALLFGLYKYLKHEIPGLGLIGVSVVPVCAALNVFVYGSQITVLPGLARALAADPGNSTYETLIAEFIHYGTGIVPALNGYAYALLGIPSICFAAPLLPRGGFATWSGVFLVLNAVACLLGLIGHVTQIAAFSMGVLLGGLLWTVAVFFLWRYLTKEATKA